MGRVDDRSSSEGSGDRKPIAVAKTAFDERIGQFSFDGHWVAYQTNESGEFQIVVQPFPEPTGKWQVSTSGGTQPRWRADGKELYYHAQGAVMSVTVPAGTAFRPGMPQRLFPMPKGWKGEPEGDGKRFLFAVPAEKTAPQPFTVVLNWQAELKK